MTNVTARHGQGAVHLGAEGSEDIQGNWRPACGMQSINSYARTPAKLRPTDQAVTCKRCLKSIAKQTQADATENRRQQAIANIAKGRNDIESDRSGKTGIETLQELLTFD